MRSASAARWARAAATSCGSSSPRPCWFASSGGVRRDSCFSFALGFGLTQILSGARLSYSTLSIVAALLTSTLIGVVFGFMPARSAARLDPVQALARE